MKNILLLTIILSGCDLFKHKKECEWYAMPEKDNMHKVDEGYIPVCVRNYVTLKQNCLLQAKLEVVEEIYGKAFRYDDMIIESTGRFPKLFKGVKETCTPSPEAKR